MKPYVRTVSLMVLFLLVGGSRIGYAQQVNYSGSLQFSSGNYYFTERTESLYFNNGVGVSGSNLSVYLNVPLITQSTPWTSYSSTGVGPLPTGGPQHGRVQQGGEETGLMALQQQRGKRRVHLGSADSLQVPQTHMGDPSVSASLKLYGSRSGTTILNAHAGIKLPLADPDAGFGTGAWDWGAGLGWSQRVTDRYLWMLSGSYWQMGDMDELELREILSYSAAVGRTFQEAKWMVTASVFGSTRMIDDVDPPITTGGSIMLRATTRLRLNASVMLGLTESASDVSASIGWSVSL